MIWIWVALGVVVLALIVLAAVVAGTARRAAPLARLMASPELRAEVEHVQQRAADLQGAVADVQERVQTTQERIEAIKAARTSA